MTFVAEARGRKTLALDRDLQWPHAVLLRASKHFDGGPRLADPVAEDACNPLQWTGVLLRHNFWPREITMTDNRMANTIGIDQLVQSITSATIRAIKQENPGTDVAERGLFVHFRVICGYPPVTEKALMSAEGEE